MTVCVAPFPVSEERADGTCHRFPLEKLSHCEMASSSGIRGEPVA